MESLTEHNAADFITPSILSVSLTHTHTHSTSCRPPRPHLAPPTRNILWFRLYLYILRRIKVIYLVRYISAAAN